MRAIRLFVLGFAAILAGLIGLSAQAQAAPVSLTFDNGRLTIGDLFNNRVILPAPGQFPSDDLPLPQRTDIQLNGELNGNQITIPATTNPGTQFPYMFMYHPTETDLRIPITMRLNDPGLTGTWDAATGAMTLEGKVDLIVVTGTGSTFPLPDSMTDVATPPLGLFARCRIDDLPLSLSTANTSPTTGQAFTGGFGVGGALTASWETLPDAVSENGGACDQLNPLLHTYGGLWLSNGVVEPKPQVDPEPSCETDRKLCPQPTFAMIDGIRITPVKRNLKPGRKAVLTVRVLNIGSAAAENLALKLKSTNKRVKLPKVVTLTVPANSTATAKFKVRALKKAKGRTVITASAEGYYGQAYLKIPKRKKKK